VGPSGGDWFAAAHWSPPGVPAPDDTINLAAGLISLSNSVSIAGTLNISGGTLARANTTNPVILSIEGSFNWSGGTLSSLPLMIQSNAVLNVQPATIVFLQGSLTNYGRVNWVKGAFGVVCQGFGPIVNMKGALWDIQCDVNFSGCGGPNGFFLNHGTFRKSAGPGTTGWVLEMRNSSGAVLVQQGTLFLQGSGALDGYYEVFDGALLKFGTGTFGYGAAPVLNGPGTFQWVSGALTLQGDVIPRLEMLGGALTLSPGFQGGAITNLTLGSGITLLGGNAVAGQFNLDGANVAGPLVVRSNAMLNWSAGAVSAPLTIASNGVLNINSASSVTLASSLNNAGTVNWLNGAIFPSCAGFGPIVNQAGALWDIQCDAVLGSCGANPNGYFLNEGLLRKSANAGITGWGQPLRNAGMVSILQGTLKHEGGGPLEGLYELAGGTLMQFGVRSFSASTNVVFSGPGSAQFISGGLALADDVITNLSLLGGTVSLSTNFQGGAITNVALGAGVTLAGTNTVSGTFNLNGATLADRLFVLDGATVHWRAGSAAGGITVQSNGLVNVNASGTVTAQGSVTNSGTIAVRQGTLALNGGFAPLGGMLRFGLSGLNSFGRIAIPGATTLNGTVGVDWLNGYVPALSNSFAVLTYGSRTGVFTDLDLPPAALWQTAYGATAFTLKVVAIHKLAFAAGPGSTNAGAVLEPVGVQVQNSSGQPVATNGVPVTLALASGTGPLNGTLTQITDVNGRATFRDLSLTIAGAKTITASASAAGLTPVTSGTLSIAAGGPAQLVLVTPISSPQAVPFLRPEPLLRVLDAFGNTAVTPVPVRVQLSSGGGGRLGGATNLNVTGQASFNLSYALADPNVAETFVTYFESPGLPPVTNNPVLASFVVTNLVLQHGNSVLRIDPTTQGGLYSWTVDGVEQAHQHWFWLRTGTNLTQTSFDRLGTPWGLARTSSNAVVNYFAQGLSVQAGFTLRGGPAGSQVSELAETLTLQNATNAPVPLHLFAYADFDLNGSPYQDSVSRPSADVFLQQGKDIQIATKVESPLPDHWEAGYYGITLGSLLLPNPITLSDTFLPQAAGDQTLAWQWEAQVGVGQTLAVQLTHQLGPTLPRLGASLVTTPVRLQIERIEGGILLSWQADGATDWQIQRASLLPTGLVWRTLTNRPVEVEGRYQIMQPLGFDGHFYRLWSRRSNSLAASGPNPLSPRTAFYRVRVWP
jgi:hypothetical protein